MPLLKSLRVNFTWLAERVSRLCAWQKPHRHSAGLWGYVAALGLVFGCGLSKAAESSASAHSQSPAQSVSADLDVAQWMAHMRGAACRRSYIGTFVVISATGAMSSSRIAHACDGALQVERVETLSGMPRTVFRRNGEVRTFFASSRTVRTDRSDATALFPQPSAVAGTKLAQFYAVQRLGLERVAGRSADVLWFKPQDDLRLGYRIWADQDTGLVMKLQTLSPNSHVMEQAAFSEIDWNASVKAEDLSRAMDAVDGYQRVSPEVRKTSAQEEGWVLRQPVDGFVPVQCYRRTLSAEVGTRSVLQCLYSDGLASVSLFMEPMDVTRHGSLQAQEVSMGATQMLARKAGEDTWLTIVGEVPRKTLQLFSKHWDRLR